MTTSKVTTDLTSSDSFSVFPTIVESGRELAASLSRDVFSFLISSGLGSEGDLAPSALAPSLPPVAAAAPPFLASSAAFLAASFAALPVSSASSFSASFLAFSSTSETLSSLIFSCDCLASSRFFLRQRGLMLVPSKTPMESPPKKMDQPAFSN